MEVSIGRNFRQLSFKAQNIGKDFILNDRNVLDTRLIIKGSHDLYEDLSCNVLYYAAYSMLHALNAVKPISRQKAACLFRINAAPRQVRLFFWKPTNIIYLNDQRLSMQTPIQRC